MPTGRREYRHSTLMVVAITSGLIGLSTALAYMQLPPQPYTMILFLAFGQAMIGLSIALFAFAVIRDIVSRISSIADQPYKEGDIIFRQGDLGEHLYVIKTGHVEVVREDGEDNEQILSRLGPGEYFGEMGILTDAPRNATVRAATDAEILAIHRDDFDTLQGSIPVLRQSVKAAMKRRS